MRVPKTLGPAVGRFFGNFKHTKGPMAGKRFVFEPWQQHDIDLMYELYPNGRRRWRSILYGVARGNGKSPIAAGIGVVEVTSREDEPDVYCAGVDRKGARIVHDFQTAFVTGSPLRDYCDVQQKAITYRPNGGTLETLSGDGYRAHGLSPSATIRDEKHGWLTDKQVELHWALETGMQKRFDSITVDITTAGWDRATLLGEQFEANLETMDLDIREDGFVIVGRDVESQSLMIWRGAPADADPTDPVTWRRANPALWIPTEELRRLALTLPENVFRRLILNQWTESMSRWLALGSWERLTSERRLEEQESAALVFCGTYQRDSAALVACSPDPDPHISVLGLWEKPRDAEGWTVPVSEVEKAVHSALRDLNVTSFVCDKPGWEDETEEWAEQYGSVVSFPLERNRRKRMVAAAARFYSLVANAGLTHEGHRDLVRQLAQVTAKETSEGALISRAVGSDGRPAAGKYIDAAVAAVLAVDEALVAEGDSVYEERGLVTL